MQGVPARRVPLVGEFSTRVALPENLEGPILTGAVGPGHQKVPEADEQEWSEEPRSQRPLSAIPQPLDPSIMSL